MDQAGGRVPGWRVDPDSGEAASGFKEIDQEAAEEAASAGEGVALTVTPPVAEEVAPVNVTPSVEETEATPAAEEAEVTPAAKEVAPGWMTWQFPSPCW